MQIVSSINILKYIIIIIIIGIFFHSLFFRCVLSQPIWVGWLVGVLWHINLCKLFNTKSIFIQIVSSISTNSV